MGDIYIPPIIGSYTTSGLPDPTTISNQFAEVTDIPGVGVGLMWSDGAIWHPIPFSAQKLRIQTASDGTYTWVYPLAYPAGYIPRVSCIAEAMSGVTDIINVQVDGTPSNTQCKFHVTRSPITAIALLGLSIGVPVAQASVGATWIHIEVFG